MRWSGFGLSVLGIAFVVAKFIEYANEIDLSIFAASAVPISGLAATYGIAGLRQGNPISGLAATYGIAGESDFSVSRICMERLIGSLRDGG